MATNDQMNQIYQYTVGLFKAAPGAYLANLEAFVDAGNSPQDMAMALAGSDIFTSLSSGYSPAVSDEIFATTFLNNLLGNTVSEANFDAGVTAVQDMIAAGATRAEAAIVAVELIAAVPADDDNWGDARQQLDSRIAAARAYTENPMYDEDDLSGDIDFLQNVVEQSGVTFNLDPATAAGADVMRLTGDQAVRIDFTNSANQITGLDLDGDGEIAGDQFSNAENEITGMASDFEIVDAYARNPLNEFDKTNNFLGDIDYDGTGVDGDGQNTDGNIFLGGLGADTARAGIGNDFLAGGGVAGAGSDELYGGRNADFFFASLSDLSTTDGDSLQISGGQTTDDSAVAGDTAMDSDWLLLEVADDEDGTIVNLNDDSDATGDGDGTSTDTPGEQYVLTGDSGAWVYMTEIENVDASGNLYRFLDDVDVALGEGGMMVEGENVGIGATSQLNIIGSGANNILIGGFDNDLIQGADGNDLLFGGNLDYNNNPNTQGIVNDGVDELFGGAGDDNIVFEADGGIYEGDSAQDADGAGNDTLWLTHLTFGEQNVEEMTTDDALRFDLAVGKEGGLDNAAGYGGADEAPDANGAYTADQSNYADGVNRGAVQDVENVIATGLGGVDYLAAGTNDPELTFANQQNFAGIDSDLDLRGTDGNNVLYANTGNDVIEGREGDDMLSGGEGQDDFIFYLDGAQDNVEGVDVIHRQTDADSDGIWDTDAEGDELYGRDFGLGGDQDPDSSYLYIDISASDIAAANKELNNFSIDLGGETFEVVEEENVVALEAATNAEEVAAVITDIFADDADVSVSFNGSIVTIEDGIGRGFDNFDVTGRVVGGGETFTNPVVTTEIIEGASANDRLIYASYEDRADGELRDDDSVLGSNISLGTDAYAEDLVINFADDGTRIAEDQAYDLTFENLTTQDVVTIEVNGVEFSLQVGVDLDGNIIDDEDGPADAQADIQDAFLARLEGFINSFMDDDTAAGQVNANLAGSTITLTQTDYNGEETVFMSEPTVTIDQLSGGEVAAAEVTNASQHELHLLDFDGRDGNLDQDNVLFIGDTGDNRAALQTADNAGETLTGKNAVLIDNASDTHAATVANTGDAIADSQATNDDLDGSAEIYAVHGDDLLLGGDGDDTVEAGTGDDRVIGSLGDDTLDGGKNLYSVQVLGETETRVYELNKWEADNFTLDGEVITSLDLIDQTEDGTSLIDGEFDDTLLFQQADFVAGETEFTITLNDYVLDGGVVELQNDGAGTVDVDVDGDGTFESNTTFTNFENIRTVSGIGNAVANDGQGNDTLDVSSLSTDTDGISYDLTNGNNAGEVNYSADAHADTDRPDSADFESLVLKVDGVENVIGGQGDDLLLIDETEAAKNNHFDAGTGDDRIEYLNDYNAATTAPEPTVTISVNTATDTDEVTMTNGRVGSVEAVDTLEGVEFITLGGDTAQSTRADDVVDVTAMISGAVVDYTDGEVRDLNGNVQVVIENIFEMENVWADGDDTVIVADEDVMSQNANHDNNSADITFATFMDYDELDADNQRVAFQNQDTGEIQDVTNEGLFTFNMSKTGVVADTDTVDYSQALDSIATVVSRGDNQYVMVDEDDNVSDAFSNGSVTRIDHLMSAEQIVASQAESVLDFTGMEEEIEVSFQFDDANADAATDTMESIVRIGDADGNTIEGIPNYVERFDMDQDDDVDAFNNAAWTRIEGGDTAERIFYDGSEDLANLAGVDHRYTDDSLNLRGGTNEVSYYAMETSIHAQIDVTAFDEDNASTTGLVETTINFADGTAAYDGGTNELTGSGTHTITSYTSDNDVSEGTLKIAASQDAEDSLTFDSVTDKLYILGTSAGVIDVRIETAPNEYLDTMRLTGFEIVQDQATDDVYTMEDLGLVYGNLTLEDAAADDSDTIAVGDDAIGFQAAGADEISLEVLNDEFGFDFDILDITGVTDNGLTIIGDTDGTRDIADDGGDPEELILGDLDLVDDVQLFDALALTDASVTSAGSSFDLDMTDGELQDAGDSTLFTFDGSTDTLDASRVTTDLDLTVTGAGDVTVIGGSGDDTITGSDGDNTLRGGAGDDVLDGDFTAAVGETQVVTFAPGNLADDDILSVGGVTLATSVDTDGSDIVLASDPADEDQIGAGFANYSDANWEAALGLNAGDIDSVDYDSASNELSFNFNPQAGDVAAIVTGLADSTDADGIDAGTTIVAPAVTDDAVGYVAQAESDDTYVFEATADENGVDTINNFTDPATTDDILDFTAFFGAAAGFNAGPYDATSAGDVNVDGDVNIFDNAGTGLTAASLAAEFAGGGTAFATAADDLAVILEIDSTDTDEDVNVWFVSDADGDGTIAESEVAQVGVVTEAGDFNFAGTNFA